MGDAAERLVADRLRAALPPETRLHPNVRFVARTRPGGPAHDGEADLVLVDPTNGLLVIEVKRGQPGRDAHGRWHIGAHDLPRSPFEQAEAAKHDLVRALRDLPDWPKGHEPRAGHAVAFPEVDLASLPAGHVLLGPDAPRDIVLDADALADDHAAARAVARAFAFWVGDGSRGGALGDQEMALVDAFLAPTLELHRLLRHDVEDTRTRLVAASNAQLLILNQARSQRRVEVVGPAGSGKSLVAVEKARRLAREGWRTLVRVLQPATRERGRPGDRRRCPDRRPTVTTFHRLCETLGRRAGVLAAKPDDPHREWWDEALPQALDAAIERLADERFHAIVVDEGQDFEPGWLESLQFLLHTRADAVFWVFHDPGQALFRDDRVAELDGLVRLELMEDYRSPAPVAELAGRFYRGPDTPVPAGSSGREPRVIEAAPGAPTVEAVRHELHRLLHTEDLRPWQIAVLSGRSARDSDVWHQRVFGNAVLWNGAVDDAGGSLGLPADEVPEEPRDTVLFETVRRFKGLEREVVILCELPTRGIGWTSSATRDDARHDPAHRHRDAGAGRTPRGRPCRAMTAELARRARMMGAT